MQSPPRFLRAARASPECGRPRRPSGGISMPTMSRIPRWVGARRPRGAVSSNQRTADRVQSRTDRLHIESWPAAPTHTGDCMLQLTQWGGKYEKRAPPLRPRRLWWGTDPEQPGLQGRAGTHVGRACGARHSLSATPARQLAGWRGLLQKGKGGVRSTGLCFAKACTKQQFRTAAQATSQVRAAHAYQKPSFFQG